MWPSPAPWFPLRGWDLLWQLVPQWDFQGVLLNNPSSQATYLTARRLEGFSTAPLALLKSRSSVKQMQMLLAQKDPVTSGCVTGKQHS